MGKYRNIFLKIWPVIFIFFLVFFFLRKVLFPTATEIVYGGDLLSQFYFWKGYLKESLKRGFIPFWNPYNFSGTPFLAHPSVAFFYPATILYLLFPLNSAFSLNYFIHLLIAGFGMYWLAKKYMDTFTSLFSSSIFVLSGFFAARIYAGHVDLFTTSVWIPLVFGSIKEVLETGSKRKMALAIVFFSLQILAGYQAYVLFTLEFILAYLLFYLIKHCLFEWQSIWRKISKLMQVVFFSVLLTTVSWLPTWQLTRLSIRGGGLPYDLAAWGSLPVSGLRLFFYPLNRVELNKISFNLGGGPLPNPFDHFVGRIPLVVIFIFLVLRLTRPLFPKWREKLKINTDFWFFVVICLFYLWLSFGYFVTPNLHYFFYQLIPFYDYIRIPIQHLIYLVFLVPLILGMVVSFLKNNVVKLILLLFLILELFLFSSKYIFLTTIPEQTFDKKLIFYLKNKKGKGRLLPYFRVVSPVLKALDLNASMQYKLESTSGYDPVILKNYYRFIDLVNKQPYSSILSYNVEIPPFNLTPNITDYLNIDSILTEKGSDVVDRKLPSYKTTLQGEMYSLYEKESVWPRFFLVDRIRGYSSLAELQNIFINENPDFSKVLLVNQEDLDSLPVLDLPCQEKDLGKIKIVSYNPNFIVLKINANCNSFLSSSEVYYPGWKARINGRPSKVFLSNFSFRSIYVPKGEHRVEFYYYPYIYYIGGLVSAITLATLLLFYFYLTP